ncbi:MAG: hypothetical protein ABI954_07705 [Pyrinomonadaceae bacterium]
MLSWKPPAKHNCIQIALNAEAQSIDENAPRLIADLGDQEIKQFALAPDGNSFAYNRGEWLLEAVLVDGLK